jgi:hypothetical protein
VQIHEVSVEHDQEKLICDRHCETRTMGGRVPSGAFVLESDFALTKTLGGCLRTGIGRSCATFDSSTRARAAHNSRSQLPRVTRRRYGPRKKSMC